MKKPLLSLALFCLILPVLAGTLVPDAALRERYTNASPEEQAEIRAEINARRHREIIARFDRDGSGTLNSEEQAVAIQTLRKEWLELQAARKQAVSERNQQFEAMRKSMLEHRKEIYPDGPRQSKP